MTKTSQTLVTKSERFILLGLFIMVLAGITGYNISDFPKPDYTTTIVMGVSGLLTAAVGGFQSYRLDGLET